MKYTGKKEKNKSERSVVVEDIVTKDLDRAIRERRPRNMDTEPDCNIYIYIKIILQISANK